MREFVAGAGFVAALSIAFLFLRNWRRDREPLFRWFGLAFAVLAVHYALLPVLVPRAEDRPVAYSMRLLAFGLIIFGIVDKNRA